MEISTLIGTVALAVNRAPAAGFTMRDLKRLCRELNPHLAFEGHGPYASLDTLERRGVVEVVNDGGRGRTKTWRRVRRTHEALPIPFPDEAADEKGLPRAAGGNGQGGGGRFLFGRVQPGAVLGSVVDFLATLPAEFTVPDVESYIKGTDPELHQAMSLTAVAGALAALERRGCVRRTRKIGRRQGWRRA